MHRSQIRNVQNSLALFEPCGAAIMARALQRLTFADPEARAFFGDDTAHRNAKLFATIKQIVDHLDVFSELERPLLKLGGQCLAQGVRPPHLAAIRRELLAALREIAGHDWTPELERDWIAAMNATIGVMLRGYVANPRLAA